MNESLLLSANLLPFMFANIELWLHKPPTAAKRRAEVDGKVSCFIYFINWIFPLATHDETSLGILRVKPEVFPFFSRFLFTLLPSETFFLFPFIGIDDKIDRTRNFHEGCEKEREALDGDSACVVLNWKIYILFASEHHSRSSWL